MVFTLASVTCIGVINYGKFSEHNREGMLLVVHNCWWWYWGCNKKESKNLCMWYFQTVSDTVLNADHVHYQVDLFFNLHGSCLFGQLMYWKPYSCSTLIHNYHFNLLVYMHHAPHVCTYILFFRISAKWVCSESFSITLPGPSHPVNNFLDYELPFFQSVDWPFHCLCAIKSYTDRVIPV